MGINSSAKKQSKTSRKKTNMKPTILLIIMFLCIGTYSSDAQSKVSIIPKNTEKTITAKDDTLLVMPEYMFRRIKKNADRLEIAQRQVANADVQIEKLEHQIKDHKELINSKESTINDMKKKEKTYIADNKAADELIEAQKKELKKQRRIKIIALIAIPVAFVIGFFL